MFRLKILLEIFLPRPIKNRIRWNECGFQPAIINGAQKLSPLLFRQIIAIILIILVLYFVADGGIFLG
jgi:hypothetical protein